MNWLKNLLLLIAATWLALAGFVGPILFREGSYTALGHVVMLGLLAFGGIVWLCRPPAARGR